MTPSLQVDTSQVRGELRRAGVSFRRRQHELVNESALNAAEYAFENTREAHKEDIERALNKMISYEGGEEMTRAESIVLKRHPELSPSERREAANRLRRARLGAIGFVRSGFAWAMRDLNKVVRRPRKPEGVKLVAPAKGYAIPAKPGGELKASIVNTVHLHGPAAAAMQAEREKALAAGIAQETRTMPRRIESFLVRLFMKFR
jgi:hypothetical protein